MTYSPYIDAMIDELIELVRDDNHTFEPVKVREVKDIVRKMLGAHENEVLVRMKQSQDHNK
ncbi:hypothetical protein [Streptococcus mitis]|uniref:hypothetical protein n=1 Tax=Streptococcus mitis TaxID=28037 RepID=UPI001C4F9B2C|nr:hypothetical protein MismyG_0066 [Streptococcus phage MismyG]